MRISAGARIVFCVAMRENARYAQPRRAARIGPKVVVESRFAASVAARHRVSCGESPAVGMKMIDKM
jgi:hypothetical protein